MSASCAILNGSKSRDEVLKAAMMSSLMWSFLILTFAYEAQVVLPDLEGLKFENYTTLAAANSRSRGPHKQKWDFR